jgi:hypothetical protein
LPYQTITINNLKTKIMKNDLTTNAKWKTQYQIIFDNTPKKFRKTNTQITNLKSQAKIYLTIWN